MDPLNTKGDTNEIVDQRKHPRKDFPYAVLEFALDHDTTYKTFIGFTLNLSASGLCFYTPERLNKGQEIVIKSNFPDFSKKATVCWIKKYNSAFYKLGLIFS